MINQMLKLVCILFTLTGSLCISAQATSDESALQYKFLTLQGNPLVLADLIGDKPLYLKFYASWCQPCNKQMPHFQQAFLKYGSNIQFVAVNINLNESDKAILAMKDKYQMTMPIIKDESGQLANLFALAGTPMHVLIDKNANVIHKGHTLEPALEEKLTELIQDKPVTALDPLKVKKTLPAWINQPSPQLVYFSATWCDWYLADSRPLQSERCIAGQKYLNHLKQTYPDLAVTTVMSHLWTEEKDLTAYQQKFSSVIPIKIDQDNRLFSHFNIDQLPVLMVIQNAQEIWRMQDFNQYNQFPREFLEFDLK